MGDADALAHLGHMYANGMGVQQDNETALHFFKHAAEGGSSSGLFGLGYMHLTGHTTQQNYPKAFKLLQAASEMVVVNITSGFLISLFLQSLITVPAMHVRQCQQC